MEFIAVIAIILAVVFLTKAVKAYVKSYVTAEHFHKSIFKDKEKYWFNNDFSSTIYEKNDYFYWYELAEKYLPLWLNKTYIAGLEAVESTSVPKWCSDFWHWQQTKMITYLCLFATHLFVAGLFIDGSPMWGKILMIFLAFLIARIAYRQAFTFYLQKYLDK